MVLSSRRLVVFFALSTFAGASAIFACSTDNGTTQPLPSSQDVRSDRGNPDDPDAPIDPGAPDACADAFVPRPSPGPRCLGVIDAGGDGGTGGKNCTGKVQICCSDGITPGTSNQFEPSECIDGTVSGNGFVEGECTPTFTGDGGSEWHCTEADHCPGSGAICCLLPSPAGNPIPAQHNDWPGCGTTKYVPGRFVGGTRCRATCNAGELQLCSSTAECKAGECIFLETSGRNIGYCRVQ